MKRAISLLGLALAALATSAHVGSPEVWFDGAAGPYTVRVMVRPPDVVPGLADIIVRVRGGRADRVLVTPSRWDAGEGGAPPPDVAEPVPGDAETYTARLWLMARGSYRITVNIEGPAGTGTAVVPVAALATRRLEMQKATGWGLAAAGVFLFIGLLTLVRAAVRESVLPPGDMPSPRRRRAARFATVAAGAVAALALFGGWKWWDGVDRSYRARLDRPWNAVAAVLPAASGPVLRLAITDSLWVMRNDSEWLAANNRYARPPLIPDHGKMMHMFLVREPAMDAFAHVHPTTSDSVAFDVTLPELPAGRYTAYADIVLESGDAQTMVTEVELGADAAKPGNPASGLEGDPDDASWVGSTDRMDAAEVAVNGMRISLEPRTFVTGEAGELRMKVLDNAGGPAALEPYMGMAGHAMIRRDDGSVFVHLHPLGTVSAAAKRALEERTPADSIYGALGQRLSASARHDAHTMAMQVGAGGAVTFPYAFPQPGRYRVWAQVKVNGEIVTGAWDVEVAPK